MPSADASSGWAFDSHFRDSYRDEHGTETVLHEYLVDGWLDEGVPSIGGAQAEARVLPWIECPAAVASAERMAGRPLAELRRCARSPSSSSTGTCTHLNDMFRFLSDLFRCSGWPTCRPPLTGGSTVKPPSVRGGSIGRQTDLGPGPNWRREMTDIMKGVRILEVAEHTFVPAASAILADWGAEVIKMEHVERGDAMRGLASSGVMAMGGDVHVLLEHSNRGKKSIGVDLTTSKGVDVVYRLAATCDVFLTNKLPAVRKKLHVELDDIRAHNPNIIYVAGTGGGERGPDADKGGYDFLSYWCRAGSAMGCTPAGRRRSGGPAGSRLWRLDRRHDHRRRDHGSALPSRADGRGDLGRRLAARRGALGHEPGRGPVAADGYPLAAASRLGRGGGPSNPLVGVYRTEDGRFIALSCLQGFYYWPAPAGPSDARTSSRTSGSPRTRCWRQTPARPARS